MKSIKLFMTILAIICSITQITQIYAKTNRYSLVTYLQQVAKAHPEQKLNTYDPLEAQATYHESKYMYSPVLNAGYNKTDNNVAGMMMGPYKSDLFSAGVSKQFPLTGTTIGASFVNNRMQYDAGIPYDTWKSYYEFTITQPLLRNGFLGNPKNKQLNILKDGVRLNRSIYNMKLEMLLFNSFSLYWRMQLTKKQLELTEASLKDAKEMLRKNRRRVNLGTVDIVEVYDFEASYVRTQADYDNLKKEYEDLKKEFLYTLGIEDKDVEDIEIDLTDQLEIELYQTNKSHIYKLAQDNRKDLQQARLQEKMARQTLEIAEVTMLPSLDFSLTSSFNGDDDNQSDMGRAISDIGFSRSHLNLTAGLQFQVPLDFRALKVVKEKATVNYEKALAQKRKLDHDIKKDIDSLIRSANYYWQTEKAYRKTVNLMEKKLKQYRKKYFSGKVDSNSYVRANDDLRMWQKTHLATLFSYKLAKARLQMAQSIFLKNYQIKELSIEGEIK